MPKKNERFKKSNKFVQSVLNWHRENGRHHLPWRQSTDPYEILVAEFLLQKTTAEQVKEVYPKFLDRFPRAEDLAESSREEILSVIGDLGLVYRADRMKKVAEELLENYGAKVPKEIEKLLELKGVGNYTANSVLCYAFGEPRPIVDTNVGRILKRVFRVEIEGRLRQSKNLWSLAGELVPEGEAKEYNFGLLDLGALVCHKNDPECTNCPVKNICSYNSKKE